MTAGLKSPTSAVCKASIASLPSQALTEGVIPMCTRPCSVLETFWGAKVPAGRQTGRRGAAASTPPL